MSNRFRTPLVYTSAVLLIMASVAFAQSTQSGTGSRGSMDGTGNTGTTGQQSQQQPMGSSATDAPSSQMGAKGVRFAIPATVAEVNQQQRTVRLQMQDGATVELKVPQKVLTELTQGDSVQLSIRKAAADSGTTGNMQPSQPGTSTGTTGRRPHSTQ
jgi:hypothetical protein